MVPETAFTTFYFEFAEPKVEEGFVEVLKWDFCNGPSV